MSVNKYSSDTNRDSDICDKQRHSPPPPLLNPFLPSPTRLPQEKQKTKQQKSRPVRSYPTRIANQSATDHANEAAEEDTHTTTTKIELMKYSRQSLLKTLRAETIPASGILEAGCVSRGSEWNRVPQRAFFWINDGTSKRFCHR